MYFSAVVPIVFYVEMRYLFLVFYKRFTLSFYPVIHGIKMPRVSLLKISCVFLIKTGNRKIPGLNWVKT